MRHPHGYGAEAGHDELILHKDRSFHSPAVSAGALAVGAQAVGALVIGSVALGAVAIGAFAIGRLAIGRARIRRLEIGELVVGKLRITEELEMPSERSGGGKVNEVGLGRGGHGR